MTHTEQIIQHQIYSQLRIMLKACGFEVRQNSVTGQYQVEGTIESAAEFFKLTVAGADVSSPAQQPAAVVGQEAVTDRDAARYRWLREYGYGLPHLEEELDNRIDAAMVMIAAAGPRT
jgi:hypothetical protein